MPEHRIIEAIEYLTYIEAHLRLTSMNPTDKASLHASISNIREYLSSLLTQW